MQTLKSFTLLALSACLATATTEIAETCIQERAHLYGIYTETDLAFTDYKYLSETEEFNTIYRMTRVQTCENAEGELVGIRSFLARYDAETYDVVSRISMNKIGTVAEDDTICEYLIIDAENGEYLDSIYFAYQNPGQIDYVRLTTNKNQQLTSGIYSTAMTTSEMTSIQDSRILAFHGYENERIAALGQVSVNLGCIKGVTTVESIEEPELIDIETLNNSHLSNGKNQSSTQENQMLYIAIGAALGICIMIVATVLFVKYKQKQWCWKSQTKANRLMPIGLADKERADIEFAG